MLQDDGGCALFYRQRERNLAALEALAPGDGRAYARAMRDLEKSAALTFGLLGGEPWSRTTLGLLAKHGWTRGLHVLSAYFGEAMQTCRDWLGMGFSLGHLARSRLPHGCCTSGSAPRALASAFMGKLSAMFTLEQVGSPMVEGGSAHVVAALAGVIEGAGGEVRAECDVERVLLRGGVAQGVSLVDGREYRARSAVVCNVTPTQLYGRLLAAGSVPAGIAERARFFRYGRGEMQYHLALDGYRNGAIRGSAALRCCT